MSERNLVNAVDGGVCYQGEPIRWWSWPRFRLVPLWSVRAADRWNAAQWNFDWLGLALWRKDTPDISVELTLDDLGLSVRIEPPYVHMRWSIPLFPYRWHQRLWRNRIRLGEP